jgi:hypothetical protein
VLASASRVHYGLYLYNNTHGMWLQENKPLSFYNITHMVRSLRPAAQSWVHVA